MPGSADRSAVARRMECERKVILLRRRLRIRTWCSPPPGRNYRRAPFRPKFRSARGTAPRSLARSRPSEPSAPMGWGSGYRLLAWVSFITVLSKRFLSASDTNRKLKHRSEQPRGPSFLHLAPPRLFPISCATGKCRSSQCRRLSRGQAARSRTAHCRRYCLS
jgi:hypothetical protein